MNQTIRSNEVITASLMNYKDEERLLSESLYRNLHVMMRFNQASEDFLQIFQPYMFIKSNAKAFFYVIHFIFNCFDAVEFGKRFRWPIVDKAGETQFRKAAVDYMNHLNITHQLGLEKLKLSNIHIPGGLKFIKIMHRFTYLIMKEEVIKPKHGALLNLNEIPDANEQLAKLEEFVDQGINFTTMLEDKSNDLSNCIDLMNGMMESFFGNYSSNEPNKERCWTCLAMEWRDELDKVVVNEVQPCLEHINAFSMQSGQLNELLTKLFEHREGNVCQYDKGTLVIAQNIVKKSNPCLGETVDGIIKNNCIDFENLLQVFVFLLPKIMNKIEIFNFRNVGALQFEDAEIDTLNTRASSVQEKMNDIEMSLVPFLGRDEEYFRKFCESNPFGHPTLPFRLMHTPQITRKSDPKRISNRLALLNGNFSQVKLFKEPLHPINRAVKKSNVSNVSNRRISIGQSSSINSLNTSLHILSKRTSVGASFNITTFATSTPAPSMHRLISSQSASALPKTPATTPRTSVDRFRQHNPALPIRSPTRRLEVIDHTNNISRNLLSAMPSNAGNADSLTVDNLIL